MPSILIFMVQISLFGALSLYLHRLSEHHGFAPLLFFLAGLMGVLNIIEIVTLFVEPMSNIVIRPGGHVYVSIILLIVLIVYITSGTRPAQVTIFGLISVDVLVLGVLVFLWLFVEVKDSSTAVWGLFAEEDLITPLFLRGVIASIITFTINMLIIIIVYQGIRNAFPTFPESLVPGIALIVALWVDSILYNLLAFLGTDRFASGLPGDILMKTLAGLLLGPMAGCYLTRVAPNLTNYIGATDRKTFDILSGEGGPLSHLVQLENELMVSRAIYEQIMLHIDEVFWLADIEKERLLYLSPRLEKFTGKPVEMFYKNPEALLDLVHPEDRAENFFKLLLSSSELEFRIQLAGDDRVRWMRNRSFPIMTPDHQIVRYAGIMEDISVRREAQSQAFALELAREKVKLLHQFVGDASHDLRTPLSAILLKLDLMNRVEDAARQKELQHEMRDVAMHLKNLIEDLFALSRIESEEEIAHLSVDFNGIVQKVSANYRIVAQNKSLSLVVELTERVVPILGEQEQLSRLVTNLVENAIHYTRQGTVTIRTTISGGQVVLEVTDTGIGIPEAQLESIFERFYRVEEARTMRYEGTGLGLAISKAIVEQHRGTLTVESKVGQGTTFRVLLPLSSEAT